MMITMNIELLLTEYPVMSALIITIVCMLIGVAINRVIAHMTAAKNNGKPKRTTGPRKKLGPVFVKLNIHRGNRNQARHERMVREQR